MIVNGFFLAKSINNYSLLQKLCKDQTFRWSMTRCIWLLIRQQCHFEGHRLSTTILGFLFDITYSIQLNTGYASPITRLKHICFLLVIDPILVNEYKMNVKILLFFYRNPWISDTQDSGLIRYCMQVQSKKLCFQILCYLI